MILLDGWLNPSRACWEMQMTGVADLLHWLYLQAGKMAAEVHSAKPGLVPGLTPDLGPVLKPVQRSKLNLRDTCSVHALYMKWLTVLYMWLQTWHWLTGM